MKKLIITVLMLSLLLASCSDKNGNETGSDTTPDTNETTTETDSTLGDNDGDGNVKESVQTIQNPTATTQTPVKRPTPQ